MIRARPLQQRLQASPMINTAAPADRGGRQIPRSEAGTEDVDLNPAQLRKREVKNENRRTNYQRRHDISPRRY